MNRRKKIGVITGLVLLVSTIVFAGFAIAPDPGPEYQPAENNTELHAALIQAGIADAAVDITPDRVLVRYEVPEEMNVNQSILVAALRAAHSEPNSETIVLQVYDEGNPLRQVTVGTQTVQRFETGEIESEDLLDAMEIQLAT